VRLRSLLALAIACVAIGLCGCGGGDGGAEAGEPATSAASYQEILSGLDRAAQSNSGYDAVARAAALHGVEKALIEAFCNFAWQIGVNGEAYKLDEHAYIVARIENAAAFIVGAGADAAIRSAMDELRGTIDLTNLNGEAVRRYRKACET